MDTDLTLQRMVELALADARGLGQGEPQQVEARRVTWPSGAIGCPQPGRLYTQALVPGFRVTLTLGGQQLRYHAAARGRPFLCPADRAEAPLADDAPL